MGSTDRWEKYRRRLGAAWKGQPGTLCDRRDWWASEEREQLVPWQDRSRAEKRARARFARLVKELAPHVAAAEALGVHDGPIPELHTREEFARRWSRERLESIAARWSAKP